MNPDLNSYLISWLDIAQSSDDEEGAVVVSMSGLSGLGADY